MSRSIRALLALALVSFALAATACTDAAGPGSPPQADADRQRITDIWGNPASARKRRRP